MSGATAATSSAVYLAAIANAVKACGTVVRLEPEEFSRILALIEKPLIVRATGGLFSKSFRYLTSYRGLAFYCRSAAELNLPGNAELVNAAKISVPEI